MAISVNKIKSYMKNELNIIISGLAGTGKTSILMEAANQLGWKMQYYSAATLDPYTDLVGLPIPNHDNKSVEYFRPKGIDEADIVFFDEANRADPKTLNTLFELIQFGSINGEKLPKLKCVVAAINPNDGEYTVEDLDPALLDRFDVYLTSDPSIDFNYFRQKFGERIATEAAGFWNEYYTSYELSKKTSKNPMIYISPRRMEKIVDAYIKIPVRSTVVDSLPMGRFTGTDSLFKRLKLAVEESARDEASIISDAPVAGGGNLTTLLGLSATDLRSSKNVKKIKIAVEETPPDSDEISRLLNNLASALKTSVGAGRAVNQWGYAISKMTPTQVRLMTKDWDQYKTRDFKEAMLSSSFKMPSLSMV